MKPCNICNQGQEGTACPPNKAYNWGRSGPRAIRSRGVPVTIDQVDAYGNLGELLTFVD